MKTKLFAATALLCGTMMTSCSTDPISAAIDAGSKIIPGTSDNEEADLKSLQEWKLNAEVSAAAVEKFGYSKCFTVETALGGDVWKVQSLITHDGKIYIGTIKCHKDIANDVCAIFKQLYESRYPVYSMVPPSDSQFSNALSAKNTFGYYLPTSGSGDLVEGRCIIVNGSEAPKEGDTAYEAFAKKGFKQEERTMDGVTYKAFTR